MELRFDDFAEYEKKSINRMKNRCNSVVNELRNSIQEASAAWQAPQPKTVTKKHTKGLPKAGGFLKIFGLVIAGIFSIAGLGMLMTFLEDGFAVVDLIESIVFFLIAAGGGVLSALGFSRLKKRRKYEAYLKLIGNRETVPIHALSDVLGMDYRDVIKDLKDMIFRGILNPAWIDMRTYRLMLTEYNEDLPPEKKEETLSRSERILLQIRADNDLIADEEVSAKIDRIEDLTRKIFAVLDRYPEKEKQLYSFLNYYLPTTLKALESYARLEAQGVETVSIRDAKKKINGMLDELCEGYERQLDKLFENDVVDITADIEVMRRMLQKDGLAENEFSKL